MSFVVLNVPFMSKWFDTDKSFLLYFCQTNKVRDASEEEEIAEEVQVKEELFHDDSDEEKLIEDGPVVNAHNKKNNEKSK